MYLPLLFKLSGAVGLILITLGVLTPHAIRRNALFIVGAVLLEAYSIYLRDWVFILLQVVFILASGYALEVEWRQQRSWSYRALKFLKLK